MEISLYAGSLLRNVATPVGKTLNEMSSPFHLVMAYIDEREERPEPIQPLMGLLNDISADLVFPLEVCNCGHRFQPLSSPQL